jgi:hypothetical protein
MYQKEELRMKLLSGFLTHQLDDDQIILDDGDAVKDFHGLVRNNESAAFIVDCLRSETTEEAIVQAMATKYDVPRDLIVQDVRTIIEKLRAIGALA